MVVWCLRCIERRDVFAAAHVLAVGGAALALPWAIWRMVTLEQNLAQEREAAARKKAEEEQKIAEQAKAEAARAEEECLRQRNEARKRAAVRRANAQAALQQCKDEFEKSRTLFTLNTVEQRCAAQIAAVAAADHAMRSAAGRFCTVGSPKSAR